MGVVGRCRTGNRTHAARQVLALKAAMQSVLQPPCHARLSGGNHGQHSDM